LAILPTKTQLPPPTITVESSCAGCNALVSRAAKAKGIYKGRPDTFDRNRIVALRKEGMGATDIAKAVGCKRGNVYKTLKAAGLN
jgi:hypothetical protein